MSRVLILANDESTIYNFRRELIAALLREGYNVIVAFPRGGDRTDEIASMGCNYIDLPMERKGTNPLKDINVIRSIEKILRQHSPDVLLSFTIKPNLYGGYASRRFGIPQIANITGLGMAVENSGIMQKISLLLYKIFMKDTKCFFFQNEENKEFLQSKGVAKSNAKIIPGSGVNIERFKLLSYPSDEVIRFLYVGRVMKEKGIEQFLEAAKVIRNQYENTEFHIIGPCEQDYKGVLDDCQGKGYIVYHGPQNDVRDFHITSHCTIHPSYYPEGMSNVLLESAASGRPVITTNRSGCKEIVDDGITGFIIKEKDNIDLIQKIKKFIRLSYEEKKKMGLNGRAKVELEFDRDTVVNEYLSEIRRLIGER